MTESSISLSIRKALEKMGIPNYRVNSGRVRVRGGWMQGAKKGTPDILCHPLVRWAPHWIRMPFWIEVKAPKGKLTKEQLDFGDEARKRGEGWICAESVDDVLRELREVGAR
jgi:hypothetical protein